MYLVLYINRWKDANTKDPKFFFSCLVLVDSVLPLQAEFE